MKPHTRLFLVIVLNKVTELTANWTCPFRREDLPSVKDFARAGTADEAVSKLSTLLGMRGASKPGLFWTLFQENADILHCASDTPAREIVTYNPRQMHGWPDGIVPYEVEETEISEEDAAKIVAGMKYINDTTCVKFVPRTNQEIYLQFNAIDGPYSVVTTGYNYEGGNYVSLHRDYFKQHSILLALMAALGFTREHHRHDRDQYITFAALRPTDTEMLNYVYQKHQQNFYDSEFDYDYDSVTHMTPTEAQRLGFSMTAKSGRPFHIHQDRLSLIDRMKIINLYQCELNITQYAPVPPPYTGKPPHLGSTTPPAPGEGGMRPGLLPTDRPAPAGVLEQDNYDYYMSSNAVRTSVPSRRWFIQHHDNDITFIVYLLILFLVYFSHNDIVL